MALGDELACLLDLLPELVKCLLLCRREVAHTARGRLVVGVGHARGQLARALLGAHRCRGAGRRRVGAVIVGEIVYLYRLLALAGTIV